MKKHYKEYLNDILFSLSQKLPISIRSVLSKKIFPPVLENKKDIKLYGYSFFEPGVKIGMGTYIHSGAYLSHISIGRYCRIAKNFKYICLYSGSYEHFSNYSAVQFSTLANARLKKLDFCSKEAKNESEGTHCVIGHDVWIGENVTILGNVNIGNGSVLGAGSIVTKDVDPFSIVAGVPARFIKYRYSEDKIALMQQLEWWNWSMDKIYENYERLCNFDKTLLDEKLCSM